MSEQVGYLCQTQASRYANHVVACYHDIVSLYLIVGQIQEVEHKN